MRKELDWSSKIMKQKWYAMYNTLQDGGLSMEIIDKTKEKTEEQWQLGDVLVTNTGNISLIVKNNYQKYCLMNINPGVEWAYSTREDDIFLDSCETLEKLHKKFFPTWHKVNAKLLIE